MKKGDIVLVPFPFTDLTGNKNQPTLILIESDDDVTVCFLTTQIHWLNENDFLVYPSDSNGLKKTSVVRLSKIATLDKSSLLGRLATLEKKYFDTLNTSLINLLKLDT